MHTGQASTSRRLEQACWAAAIACLAPFTLAWGARHVAAAAAIPAEMAARDVGTRHVTAPGPQSLPADAQRAAPDPGTPDTPTTRPDSRAALQQQWSPQRRDAFARFLALAMPTPVATLHVPRTGQTLPVFADADEYAMTVGAGHLPDSSALDADGNIALTAHRDGTFRMLEDLRIGDPLRLRVAGAERRFIVRRRFVVEPDEIGVLAPTPVPTLTLITCYPFWFVGSAPQRFILQAELAEPGAGETGPGATTPGNPVTAGAGSSWHHPSNRLAKRSKE
jgi:sortase A